MKDPHDVIEEFNHSQKEQYTRDTGFKVGDTVYLKSDANRANSMTITGFDSGLLSPDSVDVIVSYTTAQKIIMSDLFPNEALES